MKKLFFLVVLLVVGLMFMVSCKEGPLDPPAQKFTITASVVNGIGGKIIAPTEVAIGAKFEIVAEADSGYIPKTITVNGVTSPLTSKNFIVTSGASTNYDLKVMFEITPFGLLIQHPWKLAKAQIRKINTAQWYPDRLRDEIYSFGANKRFTMKNSNGELVGDGDYVFKTDSVIIGGGLKNKIIVLTPDTLVLRIRIPFIGYQTGPDPTKDYEGLETFTKQ